MNSTAATLPRRRVNAANDEVRLRHVNDDLRLRHLVQLAFDAKLSDRPQYVDRLVATIKRAKDSQLAISELIDLCLNADASDRIGFAIDVLCQCADRICEYVWRYAVRDIENHKAMYDDRPYKPNDAYWRIMLMSVAMADAAPSRKLQIIGLCKSANSRGMQEILVTALDEIEDTEATKMLRHFAQNSDFELVRELANQSIEDR